MFFIYYRIDYHTLLTIYERTGDRRSPTEAAVEAMFDRIAHKQVENALPSG